MKPLALVTTLALCLGLMACGGGMRYSMLITSDPPDALVYVNDYPRGVTPVEVPYLYIGTYRIQMEADGYEPIDMLQKMHKPWYTWIPFSSLFYDMLPFPIHHEVPLHCVMTPVPEDEF